MIFCLLSVFCLIFIFLSFSPFDRSFSPFERCDVCISTSKMFLIACLPILWNFGYNYPLTIPFVADKRKYNSKSVVEECLIFGHFWEDFHFYGLCLQEPPHIMTLIQYLSITNACHKNHLRVIILSLSFYWQCVFK